ncbi:MAG TPA: phosphoribosyltransferase family protein [Acidimicrobiia bacterium]
MFVQQVVAAVFPTRCPGCGAPANPICDRCAASLPPAPSAAPPPGVDAWVAPFSYEGVARELVARVKYRQARAALPWLGAAVARAVAATWSPVAMGAVTWTPTTASRRRARGFDHAELLARAVARELGLAVVPTLRRRPGPHQTGLASAARRRGPRFGARAGRLPAQVLVVDDVATTGATLAAAARALRRAGCERVVAATAARTPPGRSNSRIPRELHHAE